MNERVKIETHEPSEIRTQLPFEQHHAFIIGIDKYEQVSPLQTAVNDASKLAEVLATQQHFCVHPPLLNAKGAEIRNLLKSLPEQVGKDDRVLFYFAGHGIAADGEDGPAGYLVPADADPTEVKTFLPMEDLHKMLDELPCRHLLLILDCCFSGAFKWSSQFRAIGTLMPKKIYKERFDRFIQDPAWQVITSAAYDQKALDVLQGKATGDRGIKDAANGTHSPFALALFNGLAGAADIKVEQEGDGVITATELYAYIRDQIEPATIKESQKLRQTPGFFPLRKHDKGEFIFLHPRHRLNLPPIPKRSPYKGLQSFDEADKELFYGRDRVIKELREKAENNKLLVITGASGTGKSSVIKAGLLPVLREEGFRILPVIRPGMNPVSALEKGLNDTGVSLPDGASLKKLGETKTVLLIDQYEELITRCSNPAEREQFVALLRKMLDETPEATLKIILTVRADFEPQLNDGELKDYWLAGRCTVPPFSVEELKEVIVMPMIQEVLIFDPPELVDQIIEEVVQSPGALPLLSYTLSELYEAYRTSGRQDRALQKDDYEKLGGVMGALRTKADALYHSLDTGGQNTMRKIMLRLVSVQGELAGKRVLMNELIYTEAAENQRVHAVIDQLVEARLIVKGKDYIEPAHDALVRAWKTLREWIHTIGEDKILLNAKVNVAANEYAESQNVKFLWNDNPHLSVLQQDLSKPNQWLNAKEFDFIQKSVLRKIKRARILRGIVAGVLIVLSALTVWALLSRAEAIRNAKKDRASRLTMVANQALAEDNTRALRIAEAAYGIFQSRSETKVQKALSDAFHSQEQAFFYAANLPHDEPVTAAAFAPDGQLILTATEGGLVKLWDTKGNFLRRFKHDDYEINAVNFSLDGKQFLTASRDNTIRLWDVTGALLDSLLNREEVALANFAAADNRVVGNPAEHALARRFKAPEEVYRISVSADARRILTFMADGSVKLWDEQENFLRDLGYNTAAAFSPVDDRIVTASAGGMVRFYDANGNAMDSLKYHAEVNQALFSPDGKCLLTASHDHTAKLWDLSQQLVHRLSLRGSEVKSAVFSPEGKWVLTAGYDSAAVLWDEYGKRIDSLKHTGVVNAAIFSADGKRILTASRDSTAKLWTLAESNAVITLPHQGEVYNAVFSPHGEAQILTASADSTAKLWSRHGALLHTFRHDGEVHTATFSPDGQYVLTASQDSTAKLWDMNGKTLATFRHRGEVNAAVFSPDNGKRILTASKDSTAKLWRSNGALIAELRHGHAVRFVLYAPHGRYLLTAAKSIAKLWDEEGNWVASLEHKFTVTAAAFSPDDKYILTATSEGSPEEEESAVLWNLQGERIVNYGEHSAQVNAIVFSPEGQRFLTAAKDGFAMIWWLPEKIFAWLKNAPVQRLTAEEKKQFEIAQ